MAYATKYRFTFDSIHGATYRILIQKDGYSGSILERCLGKAPVLRRKHSERVFGTSMEIYAECKADGEFTELYTSSPTEFRVQLYRGNSLKWSGYVSPELYSEPDIAPPYDVQIIATDGLGELKLHTFQAQGDKSLRQLFTYLLSFTGITANINYISNLSGKDSAGNSVSVANLWGSATINLDYKAGESCYDVLQYLLTTLCASITYQNTQWLVWRDNDVTSSDLSSAALGSISSGNLWPIGYLVSSIVPAKKSVVVENPFKPGTPLVNPGMINDSGWTKQEGATYDSSRGAYLSSVYGAGIEQSLTADASRGFSVVLTMESSGLPGPSGVDTASETTGLYLNVFLYTSGTRYGILDMEDGHGPRWICNADLTPAQQQEFAGKWGLVVTAGAVGIPTKNTVSVPPFDRLLSGQGTLTINIDPPTYRYIYDCYLYKPIIKGFRDRLVIDNGARGEGQTEEIAHGRVNNTIAADYYGYLSGVLTINSRYITSFADRNFTSFSDLLSIMARNYARLVALPRLRVTGKIDTPSTLTAPPMLLQRGSVYLLLEVFSWDLRNDEMTIDAISLPNGVLSVTSETITGMTSESSSGGGGASPAGGGGSTVTWGTASNNYRPLSVNGDESAVALSGHTHPITEVTGLSAAGNPGLPTYEHPGGTESYKYKHGSTGTEQTITETFITGQPRKIDHIGTHPELAGPVAIPGFINDLAYFRVRGGRCNIYVNGILRSDEYYNYDMDALFNCAPSSLVFDGSNTYTPEQGQSITYYRGLTSADDIVRLFCNFTTLLDAVQDLGGGYFSTRFNWGSYIYIDFGQAWWGPTSCIVTIEYGRFTRTPEGDVDEILEDTANRQTFTFAGAGTGAQQQHLDFLRIPINANSGQGILSIDIQMTGFNQDNSEQTIYKYKPRISEIGVVGLNSRGPAEALMSLGQDIPIYRGITPAKDNTYDLGAAGKQWRYIRAKRVYLSASAYIEIDQDGKAHLYGASGLVVENGDIASAGSQS